MLSFTWPASLVFTLLSAALLPLHPACKSFHVRTEGRCSCSSAPAAESVTEYNGWTSVTTTLLISCYTNLLLENTHCFYIQSVWKCERSGFQQRFLLIIQFRRCFSLPVPNNKKSTLGEKNLASVCIYLFIFIFHTVPGKQILFQFRSCNMSANVTAAGQTCF